MPSKPGRPPTSGTRHGNGAGKGTGHGGPANHGAPKTIAPIAPAFPPGVSGNPSGLIGYRGMAKAERIAALKDMLWERAQSSERDSDMIAAINSLLNREEGMPVQQIINTDLPTRKLSLEQLDSAIAAIESALGGRAGDTEGGSDDTAIGRPSGIV